MGNVWSEWRSFPDPRRNGILTAPFGAGCYEIRNRDTEQRVLFGMGSFVALRMTSLLPKPLGTGTRRNERKRAYILENIEALEYRTLPCASGREAKCREQELKAESSSYIFPT